MPSRLSYQKPKPTRRKLADFQPQTDGIDGPLVEPADELDDYQEELDRLSVDVDSSASEDMPPTVAEITIQPWG